MNLNDFVVVVNGALTEEMCLHILDRYESNPDLIERVEHENKPNFNQMDLSKHLTEKNPQFHRELSERFSGLWDIYQDQVNPMFDLISKNFIWEGFRVKHYEVEKEDSFDLHSDSMNKATCSRMLSMFVYLNDVTEGGETVFPYIGLKIAPVQGSAVIFPPMWQYPHAGLAPVSNDKFLLSTYVHYA